GRCIGSITPRKGQDVLVEALAQLTTAAPVWHCQLIGSTELAPGFAKAITQQIEQAGLTDRIKLRGALDADALSNAYATADCLILPSRYEGYGMVITEAIAHGLPVITTTAGALANTLPADAGLAVSPDNAAALQDTIQTFLSDQSLQQRLRDGALQARRHLTPWSARGQAFSAALTDG
ncbi:MAG: glycosyltransferase family 4 protein, partial [Gammaproteobacteria bacterium]|nr:glycosyltransferase family 4 protein [Gammaproteobacteria bacterium]